MYYVKTKSRLVAKGFSHVAGVDYYIKPNSTTPAVAHVKIIATVANDKGLSVYHLDVSQAFGQGPVMTRLGIFNALRTCARRSHNPTRRHWKAPARIWVLLVVLV